MNATDPQPALLYSLGPLSLWNRLSDSQILVWLYLRFFFFIGPCVFVSFVMVVCFRNHFQMMGALLG